MFLKVEKWKLLHSPPFVPTNSVIEVLAGNNRSNFSVNSSPLCDNRNLPFLTSLQSENTRWGTSVIEDVDAETEEETFIKTFSVCIQKIAECLCALTTTINTNSNIN